MPVDKVTYYNRIDMGIFLYFLETCLTKEGIVFERELFSDNAEDAVECVEKELASITLEDLKRDTEKYIEQECPKTAK